MDGNEPNPVDGRVLRGERNRTAIVDALLALLRAGRLAPSARDIAAHAGVSVRSVFQHFDDLETLHAALVERQFARADQLTVAIDPSLPFEDRLGRYLASRTAFYEEVAPVRRAAALAAVDSPTLQRARDEAARRHARDVTAVFAPECTDSARDALVLVTSWESWERLRHTQRLKVPAARRAVETLVMAILGRAATR